MEQFELIRPYWNLLTEEERQQIQHTKQIITYKKGFQTHPREDHRGVLFVMNGQLRIFITSDEGREVTLFRVFTNDLCVCTATGLLDAITFDMMVDAVENTRVIMVPVSTMQPIMKKHPEVEAFLYRTASSHFSDMVWNMQQIFFLSIDQRIAQFLWDEISRSHSTTITLTHSEIAGYIGSAREVVTKVLKYFQYESVLTQQRGKILITDKEKLQKYL